jgi:hypothetical protein
MGVDEMELSGMSDYILMVSLWRWHLKGNGPQMKEILQTQRQTGSLGLGGRGILEGYFREMEAENKNTD